MGEGGAGVRVVVRVKNQTKTANVYTWGHPSNSN